MNDLLNKLNTLARARLNDALTNLPSLPRFERSPDLQRQVSDLRQRINAALDHEDELEAQVNTLREEIARLDAEADAAVAQGRDAEARYILEQLKRTEQRLSFAESDLRMHQRDAAELILKVNQLEAAVADHQAAVAGMGDTTASTSDLKTTPPAATSQSPASRLSASTAPPSRSRPLGTSQTSTANTPPASESTETPPVPLAVQPTRTQIPVESDSAATSSTSTTPGASIYTSSKIDTSIEANAGDLPDVTTPSASDTPASTTTSTPQNPATNPGTTAAPKQDAEAPQEDEPETAKSYAKRAREAAQEQADKTNTAVSQISDLIRDAQERTRARIQSLTDILEAKDREQAASPLYNRESPTPPATTSTTATTAPETVPSTSTPPNDAGKPEAEKGEDGLSERLKRLSKPE